MSILIVKKSLISAHINNVNHQIKDDIFVNYSFLCKHLIYLSLAEQVENTINLKIMKKLNYILSAVVLMAVLITVGCGGDDPAGQTAEEAVTENFSKSWELTTATYKGDPVDNMDGFILTINTNMKYSTNSSTVERTPTPWPASGDWSFKDGTVTSKSDGDFTVTRDDGLEIDVTLGATTLALGFTFIDGTHSEGGREEQVDGDWVMNFTAQ